MIKEVTVEILAIGNELLRGEILDSNSLWICQMVNSRGGRMLRVTMLPDIEKKIEIPRLDFFQTANVLTVVPFHQAELPT